MVAVAHDKTKINMIITKQEMEYRQNKNVTQDKKV